MEGRREGRKKEKRTQTNSGKREDIQKERKERNKELKKGRRGRRRRELVNTKYWRKEANMIKRKSKLRNKVGRKKNH